MTKKKFLICEVCQVELKGKDGITLGHVSSTKTINLCREHHNQTDVWFPLYDALFGDMVKNTQAESPTKTKKKAKIQWSKRKGAINI
jgi:hypothetical protein